MLKYKSGNTEHVLKYKSGNTEHVLKYKSGNTEHVLTYKSGNTEHVLKYIMLNCPNGKILFLCALTCQGLKAKWLLSDSFF